MLTLVNDKYLLPLKFLKADMSKCNCLIVAYNLCFWSSKSTLQDMEMLIGANTCETLYFILHIKALILILDCIYYFVKWF